MAHVRFVIGEIVVDVEMMDGQNLSGTSRYLGDLLEKATDEAIRFQKQTAHPEGSVDDD